MEDCLLHCSFLELSAPYFPPFLQNSERLLLTKDHGWLPRRLDLPREAWGTLLALPHTLWVRPVYSGYRDFGSLKVALVTMLSLPLKCLALHPPSVLTHRPRAGRQTASVRLRD